MQRNDNVVEPELNSVLEVPTNVSPDITPIEPDEGYTSTPVGLIQWDDCELVAEIHFIAQGDWEIHFFDPDTEKLIFSPSWRRRDIVNQILQHVADGTWTTSDKDDDEPTDLPRFSPAPAVRRTLDEKHFVRHTEDNAVQMQKILAQDDEYRGDVTHTAYLGEDWNVWVTREEDGDMLGPFVLTIEHLLDTKKAYYSRDEDDTLELHSPESEPESESKESAESSTERAGVIATLSGIVS